MMFDGQRWTRCVTVCSLPRTMWYGESNNYLAVGRIVPKGTPGAVECKHRRFRFMPPDYALVGGKPPEPDGNENGEFYWFAWAIPIPQDGHSLTNLMYGKDGKSYLMIDGKIYVRSRKAKR